MLARFPAHCLRATLVVFLFTAAACTDSLRAPPAGKTFSAESPPAFAIVTTALHTGYIHEGYSGVMMAEGGRAPYEWTIASGSLPPGLSLDSRTGRVSGKPSDGGHYSVRIAVSDSSGAKSTKPFVLIIADQPLDPYGGLMSMHSPRGGTGRFRVEKFGNRWMFVTPDGNAFWMLGVYGVTPGDAEERKDAKGVDYYQLVAKKYGDQTWRWGPQADRRLKSWGFNTIGPYSYYYSYPTMRDAHWPGGTQPVKLPFVLMVRVTDYAEKNSQGWAPGPTKSIYRGVNPRVDHDGGDFPDVFDPNFEAYARAVFKKDIYNIVPVIHSPWLVGAIVDDSDYLRGIGPGPDFPTDPPGKTHPHLGWIALVTAPSQTINAFTGKPYRDEKVYTKYALRDFLKNKYHTIAALNSAWGSNYATFDSDGGWGKGRGLLDEDGRHSWVGSDPYTLRNARPAVKADLDSFLYQIAAKYYSTIGTALKASAPDLLYFGPSSTGGWDAPARRQILEAAGKYVDVLSTEFRADAPGRLDFTAKYFGDRPLIYWYGSYANPDSGMWRHRNPDVGTARSFTTQSARGNFYAKEITAYASTVAAPTGSIPSIGVLLWDWTDSIGEQANWGIVSLMDNAYDGKEATVSGGAPGIFGSARCRDPWGYPCGAEEHNYGDFLGPATRANLGIMDSIVEAHDR